MGEFIVGFIGAGKMAQSLAGGFVAASLVKPENVWMSAPSEKNLKVVKELGYRITHSNKDVVEFAEVIFLTIKPPHLSSVIKDINLGSEFKTPLIVSVVTGVTLDALTQSLDSRFAVVRIVTNTGVQVKSGVTVFAKSPSVTNKHVELVMKLMVGVGNCTEAPESIFNAVTGVAGSGPAYVYLMIQAMADGAVKMGIPRELALNLTVHTFQGAAQMVIGTKKHPAELQDEICSPGGTTIHGLHKLECNGVRGAIVSAVEAATQRADYFAGKIQIDK